MHKITDDGLDRALSAYHVAPASPELLDRVMAALPPQRQSRASYWPRVAGFAAAALLGLWLGGLSPEPVSIGADETGYEEIAFGPATFYDTIL